MCDLLHRVVTGRIGRRHWVAAPIFSAMCLLRLLMWSFDGVSWKLGGGLASVLLISIGDGAKAGRRMEARQP